MSEGFIIAERQADGVLVDFRGLTYPSAADAMAEIQRLGDACLEVFELRAP